MLKPKPVSDEPPDIEPLVTRTLAAATLIATNEFRRLFDAAQLRPTHTMKHRLAWSQWRRRRQAQARVCHYRRRAETP